MVSRRTATICTSQTLSSSGGELWELTDVDNPGGATLKGNFPSGLTTPKGITSHDPNPTPDATAPTVTINAIPIGDEGTTVQLSYTLGTGDDAGAYDTLTPAWVVEDGTLNDAASDTPTLTRPAVTAQTDFTCDLTLTAAGTGTNAADATSDQSTAPQRTFTVRNVAVVTTDTDSIYDLSGQDTTPSAPTGGTTTESHTPTGWSRTQPNPTETQAVYRSQRTRSFSDGTFTSATVWGTPSRQRNRLLAFSEIDQSGLDAEFVALIECGEDSTVSDAQIYATSARGGPDGSIEQGDVQLDGTTDITRLRLQTSSNRVQINDNDTPTSLHLGNYFGSGGNGEDLTVYFQTVDGLATWGVGDQSPIRAGASIRWTRTTTFQGLLNNLFEGDRVGFMMARAAATELDVEVSGSASPTVAGTANVTVREAGTQDVEVLATASPSVAGTANVTLTSVDDVDVEIAASAASSVAGAVNVTLTSVDNLDVQVSATASPSVDAAVSVSLTSVDNLDVQVAASASPTVSGTARVAVTQVSNVDIQVSAAADSSTAGTVNVSKTTVDDIDVQVAAAASPAVSSAVNVTITTVDGLAVEVSATAMPTVAASASVTVTEALALSAFDDTNLDMVVLALIQAGAPPTLFRSDGTPSGTLVEGEMDLTATQAVSRIRYRTVGGNMVLTLNDNPSADNINTYFNAGGDGNDLTVYAQTLDGLSSEALSGILGSGTGQFKNFDIGSDLQSRFGSITEGDLYIFGMGRLQTEVFVELSATASPTVAATVNVSKAAVTDVDVEVDADADSSVSGTLSVTIAQVQGSMVRVSATARPTVSATLTVTKTTISNIAVEVDSRTIAGTVAATVNITIKEPPIPPEPVLVQAPGPPLQLVARPGGGGTIILTWRRSSGDDITGYDIWVSGYGWQSTGSTGLRYTVRGLPAGHRYEFRVRGVNAAGEGSGTARVEAVSHDLPAPVTYPLGATVPLLSVDRQSVVMRLDGVDVRIRVFYHPSDESWYATVEVPVGSPAVSSRRVRVNEGLFGLVKGEVSGDIFCRALGTGRGDPGREPWGQTHVLRYEV